MINRSAQYKTSSLLKQSVQAIILLTLFIFATQAMAANASPESTADKVYINFASAKELTNYLKGIGEKKSASIVQFRTENGPFLTVEDLTKVKGIGSKTVDKFSAILNFDTPKAIKKKAKK